MTFEIDKDRVGQFIWRLKGANGEIVAHGESYYTKAACERAIALVQSSRGAQVKDLTAPHDIASIIAAISGKK